MLLEHEYALDQNKIAEYFPLLSTIEGMLSIFEDLFGLVFVKTTGDNRDSISPSGKGVDIVWHDDVWLYTVWNEDFERDDFVGYLYLDLHPRPGKYGHAANFSLQPGFIANGKRHYPSTALVCNFSMPTQAKPSLLKHDEVVMLFHELGHGIHDLVAKTKFSRFHGTSTVRDFVEAPSQLLENWCWTPSQIKRLSRHWSTLSPDYEAVFQKTCAPQPEEKLPDDLIESIVSTRYVNSALYNLQQLHLGVFDMTVHQLDSDNKIESQSISKTYNKLCKTVTALDGPEVFGQDYDWGNGQAILGHLVGDYDAGYYGYLFSQVYSTDMFYTAFKADPMSKIIGRRYRHTVLESGGSRDEMSVLEEFLGRTPSTEAFYKELGIAEDNPTCRDSLIRSS